MPWVLKRIEAKTHDGNRVYAAELLSILLDNRPNRLYFGKADGVEIALRVLSVSNVFCCFCSGCNLATHLPCPLAAIQKACS